MYNTTEIIQKVQILYTVEMYGEIQSAAQAPLRAGQPARCKPVSGEENFALPTDSLLSLVNRDMYT